MSGSHANYGNPAPDWREGVTLVAGNGPSLATILPGRVLGQDRIVRANNFFFEDRFYLGQRVDLVLIGGAQRLSPFLFETLRQALTQYHLGAWSAYTPGVTRVGRRFLTQPYLPYRVANARVAKAVETLEARYQALLSTGVKSLLMAHALGARQIILAGVDLYAGPQRYVYQPGTHQRALLGADLATRGCDSAFHAADLDRAMIAWLAEQPDLSLTRAADSPALNAVLDLAPVRPGTPPEAGEKIAIHDWADWAGGAPIAALKVMHRARKWARKCRQRVFRSTS